MNTLNTFSKNPILVISGSGAALFSVKYLPAYDLLIWLVAAVALDLVSGVLKAWSKGDNTTSAGLRKTIIKILSYAGTVVMVTILVNMVARLELSNTVNLRVLIDALMGFMVFIELYSFCENIDAAYPNSLLSRYLLTPILKLLKGKLKSNPITALGKNLSNDNTTDQGESK